MAITPPKAKDPTPGMRGPLLSFWSGLSKRFPQTLQVIVPPRGGRQGTSFEDSELHTQNPEAPKMDLTYSQVLGSVFHFLLGVQVVMGLTAIPIPASDSQCTTCPATHGRHICSVVHVNPVHVCFPILQILEVKDYILL